MLLSGARCGIIAALGAACLPPGATDLVLSSAVPRGEGRVSRPEAVEARFPVTVDPTFVQEAILTSSDGGAGDYFGIRVSVSGDTAVVAAVLDDTAGGIDAGSVYVFVRSGATWSEQQKLTASDGAAGDQFGISVSVSGDTVVVGARDDDTAAGTNAGSAYVFVRSGTVWSQQQKLLASDGAEFDEFGWSVSVSGDTAIVGAYADDFLQGSAYVFVRSGTVWSEQQKLVASDGAAGDSFGFSVSASGETAVVGAWQDEAGGAAGAGSVYVFVRAGTVWSEQERLTASDGRVNDGFGYSVAISGETALVGAPNGDAAWPTAVDTGTAYVFVRSATQWSQQGRLTVSDRATGDALGSSVSLAGDMAVIGARGADVPAGANAGAAYVFARTGTTWGEQQKVTAPGGEAGDHFGVSVSVSGSTAVVGASGDDTAGGVDIGSAHVFRTDLIFKDGFQPAGATWPEAGDEDDGEARQVSGRTNGALGPRG